MSTGRDWRRWRDASRSITHVFFVPAADGLHEAVFKRFEIITARRQMNGLSQRRGCHGPNRDARLAQRAEGAYR